MGRWKGDSAVRTWLFLQLCVRRSHALVRREHDQHVQRDSITYEHRARPAIAQNGAGQHQHATLEHVQGLVRTRGLLHTEETTCQKPPPKLNANAMQRRGRETHPAAERLERVHRFLTRRSGDGQVSDGRNGQGTREAYYRARYLLMSSCRPAALDGMGSRVEGRCAESSR